MDTKNSIDATIISYQERIRNLYIEI